FFSIFFSRGTENSLKSRFKTARQRLGKKTALVSYTFLLIAILSGAYIYHSTVYVNTYRTSDESELRQVAYEKQLKHYEFLPQPKITKVNLKADLYPMERDAYFEA